MTPDVGTELVNPRTETAQVFTATADTTGGEYIEVVATYPANSAKPPLHKHPAQQETFTILEGALEVIRGDESFTAKPGDEFTVAAGVPHQMWATDDGAVFRWRTAPALRTGEMFCALWQVARDNDWQPEALQLFEVITQYGDEFCLC